MTPHSSAIRAFPLWLAPLFTFISAFVPCARGADTPSAEQILRDTKVQGGLVVVIGCDDPGLLAGLGREEAMLVQGLDTDAAKVERVRRELLSSGSYGRVSAATFDGRRLPYVGNFVNLLIAADPGDLPPVEVMRVLAPGGIAYVQQEGRWTTRVKSWPEELDQWTHYLYGPENNAVSRDSVADQPRSVQWIAEPRFGRSHEEMASMSTTVTAGGRVFFIIDEAPFASIRFRSDWKLVARDAFNGTLLWKRPIPTWTDHLRHFRSGPVHLQRRLVAVGDLVYTTLGLDAPVSAISAVTGETEMVYADTEYAEEMLLDDGVLYLVIGTSENHRTGGGLFRRDEPEPTDFRYIAAVDADSGRMLWKHPFTDQDFLLPLTLAVSDGSVFCQTTSGVVRIDGKSGESVWTTPRATPSRRMGFSAPTLVVSDGVVLCADREPSAKSPEVGLSTDGHVEWGVHGWNEQGFARRGSSKLRAYSIETGEELWNTDCSEQYNAPTDVFVVDGVAWIGTNFRGHDIKTGEVIRELPWKGDPVSMPHHRCYRNKATEQYIFTGRSGIEVVSLEDGWIGNNSWVRGTCQYGIMPANGLIYAPPNACACNNKVKVLGFFAAAPARQSLASDRVRELQSSRPEKGPAYDAAAASPASLPACPPSAWPMYRSDNARSGFVSAETPDDLQQKWSVSLGGRLTQPIAVGRQVFVAATDAHTVFALNADDGQRLWSFTAGGRIDSSPTWYRGRILFGAADGYVYCLRAADGEMVWRFLAARDDQRIAAFDQLESLWPIHGSVLIQDDILYVTAGRNSYLDGGLVLYRVNPLTGEELSHSDIYHLDPATGRQIGHEASRGFDMEGVRSDLMSGDGETVYMKHFGFDRDGQQLEEVKPHLLSVDGFLGEEWFVRSYWIYGTTVTAGWGGWAAAASKAPAGRIMAFHQDDIFGYGRVTISGGPTGHRADAYHLWRRPLAATTTGGDAQENRRTNSKGKGGLPAPVWSDPQSLVVRAMALTPSRLIVVGVPDLGQKSVDLLAYENEAETLAGFHGERGVSLRLVSTEDGSQVAEYNLPAMPVFDGLSVASGNMYVALRDGSVICWGGR